MVFFSTKKWQGLTKTFSSAGGPLYYEGRHLSEVVPVERRGPTKQGTEDTDDQPLHVFLSVAPLIFLDQSLLKSIFKTLVLNIHLAKGSLRKAANPFFPDGLYRTSLAPFILPGSSAAWTYSFFEKC